MKVSIITVCFNSEKTIEDTLKSIQSQVYSDIEYIVIDGLSKDETNEIVNKYSDIVSIHISEKDNGLYDAMNKGIQLATGDIIGILNSDDFYPNEHTLSKVMEVFSSSPDTHVVLGNVDFVRSENLTQPIRFYSSFNFTPWMMRFGFMPAHPAAFIKRSAYEIVGNYKLGYKISADFEWFTRAFIIQKLSYKKLNRVLVRMREGGVSSSGLRSYLVSSKEQVIALRENKIYSNFLLVSLRLPIKLFHKIFRKEKM